VKNLMAIRKYVFSADRQFDCFEVILDFGSGILFNDE
jgi:hypothetical protein